jgi:hypothetical protein
MACAWRSSTAPATSPQICHRRVRRGPLLLPSLSATGAATCSRTAPRRLTNPTLPTSMPLRDAMSKQSTSNPPCGWPRPSPPGWPSVDLAGSSSSARNAMEAAHPPAPRCRQQGRSGRHHADPGRDPWAQRDRRHGSGARTHRHARIANRQRRRAVRRSRERPGPQASPDAGGHRGRRRVPRQGMARLQ